MLVAIKMPTQSLTYTFAMVVALMLTSQIYHANATVSNGVFHKCGNDARRFLRWFCQDSSFNFPFPFSRIFIILRYRPPLKGLYPFQHQASVCCKVGCSEEGYKRMCRFHKTLKRCEHRVKVRRRNRRYSYCRL